MPVSYLFEISVYIELILFLGITIPGTYTTLVILVFNCIIKNNAHSTEDKIVIIIKYW